MENNSELGLRNRISEILRQVIGKEISIKLLEEAQDEQIPVDVNVPKPLREYKVKIGKIDEDLKSYGTIIVMDYGEGSKNRFLILIQKDDSEN